MLAICPEHAEHFTRAGWKKEQVGQYLFENARRSAGEWASAGLPRGESKDDMTEALSALESPDAAIPIVLGGAGGAWSMVIPTWSLGHNSKAVTSPI